MGNILSSFFNGAQRAFSQTQQVYWVCLAVNLGAFFLHALPNRTEKYYDLIGSLTFSISTLYSYFRTHDISKGISLDVPTLASVCLLLWCNRLGLFLVRRIMAAGKDRRFDTIKSSTLQFLFAWFMQANWNYIVGLPVYLLNCTRTTDSDSDSHALSNAQLVSIIGWVCGFPFEAIADEQKRRFSANANNADK